MVRVDYDIAERHHSPCRKVRTLLMFFTVFQQTIERKNSWRNKAVGFQKVEIIMIDAKIDVFSSLLFLFHETSSQTSTASINDCSALLFLHRRMKTQILSTRQSESTELFLFTQLVCTIFHQCLQFCQGLLDFRHCTRAVDEFPTLRIIHLIGHDE